MSVQLIPLDGAPGEERLVAAARLLEDLAQTCATLRASCLEQAQLLRQWSGDVRVLSRVDHAERLLLETRPTSGAAGAVSRT